MIMDIRFFTASTLAAFMVLSSCGKAADTEPAISALETFKAEQTKAYPVQIQKLAEGVWVHTSTYSLPGGSIVPSNGLVVEDEDGLILVDTAWGEMATQVLLDKLKAETGKDVTKVVITHHHNDRLAGVDLLEKKSATIFTHPDTAGLSAKKKTPIPDTSVAGLKEPGARAKFGPIEIGYPGPGYAKENLVVYVPAAKILFGGSLVLGHGQTNLGNIDGADIKAWPKSLTWTKQTYGTATIVVPSHGKGADIGLIDNTLAVLAKTVNAEADAKKTEKDK